jgi:preprotein translocase subunit SecE
MARLQKKKKAPAEKKKTKKSSADAVAEPEKNKKSQASFSVTKGVSARDNKARKTAKDSGQSAGSGQGYFRRASDYLRDVQMELKKVTWPTRKQTAGTTLVVIILVFIVAVFLGIFDYGLSKLVEVVLT